MASPQLRRSPSKRSTEVGRPKMYHLAPQDADHRFKSTLFLIEATRFESMTLTLRHKLLQDNMGLLCTLGTLVGRPVCVEFTWVAFPDGRRLCFYNPTSELVDHEMIRKWFKKNLFPLMPRVSSQPGREPVCDADGFYGCLSDIGATEFYHKD